jgi:acetyl esterase/lipase
LGTSGKDIVAHTSSWAGVLGRLIGNWAYRLYIGIGALLAVLVVIFTLAPPVVTAAHTGLFVLQVLDVSFKPQSWFTAAPLRREVGYPIPGGAGLADIYRIPDDRKRAAVLIFLGANAAGRDDHDVINLGNALARSGFVVMFHWSRTMALQHNIDPREIENLVWAFQYLKSQDYVDQARVGMGGFSVGASFAMVAAADPRIRDDVVFVNSFGGYYDMRDVIVQIASRTRFYQGQRVPWEVDPLTWQVFANELISSLDNPAERELFTRRFLRNEPVSEERLEGLSSQAQVVRQLLEGVTLEEAEALFQRLPQDFRQEMMRVSPSAHISNLEARLLIMHDQADLLIPVVESRRLVDALENRGNFRYTETEVFEHVRPGSAEGLWMLIKEGAKLYRHMYGIIGIAT